MTEAQANALVARLMAAFPQQRIDPANVAVYSERFATLEDAEVAYKVVNAIIDTAEWFPTIAAVRAEYDQALKRKRESQYALTLPDIPEEERRENLRRMAEYGAKIGREMPKVA